MYEAMITVRSVRRGLCVLSAAILTIAVVGCGPTFPPAWLLEAEPSDASGVFDADGKLRVLAIVAEPPEAQPGELVSVSSLIATHPRFGEVVLTGGQPIHTLSPRGLSVLYRLCPLPGSAPSPLPCGLHHQSVDFTELPVQSDFSTQLRIPSELGSPSVLLVTLIAADAAYSGGAMACATAAAQNDGVSPIPNHCVVAVKRIKVRHAADSAATPNHNPLIRRVLLGADEGSLMDVDLGVAIYPKLGAEVSDSDRPKWQVVIERAADAEEQEPDPRDPSRQRPELLSASLFVSSGTLESGRGSFLDLGCSGDCPQLLQTQFGWQPPAALSSSQVLEDRTYFAVVLRDDRGGASFRTGVARAR